MACSDRIRRSLAAERGQASVALVAVIPALVLLFVTLAQFALAGHAAMSAAGAARAAARAAYVGTDAEDAARAALPGALRPGMSVDLGDEGAEVEVDAPRPLPFLPRIPVSATARIGPEDGVDGG